MSFIHAITALRLLAAPLFLLFYLEGTNLGVAPSHLPLLLFGLLTLSELSDLLDGFLARRYNSVTDLGKILDPMADSILRIAVFLAFTRPPVELPLGLAFVFLYRDMLISALRTICALRGYALAARPSGKVKAVMQAFVAFSILLLMEAASLDWIELSSMQGLAAQLGSLAALYAIFSGCDYLFAHRHHIARLWLIDKAPKRATSSWTRIDPS